MAVIREQQFLTLPIVQLVPHPDNPRTHDEAAIDSSMETNDFYGTVTVRELPADDGLPAQAWQILAGHGRVESARRKGIAEVPCMVVVADDVEAIRILLADNATSDRAGYNRDILDRVLEELGDLTGTGFDVDLEELAVFVDEDEKIVPEPDDEDFERQFGLVIECRDEDHQRELYDRFVAEGLTVRVVAI
jgi:hypothetical protein